MSLENCPDCGQPWSQHTTGGCPPQNPMYGVRPCRGHWHVTGAGEDLALRGDVVQPGAGSDAFSERRAREVAAMLNANPSLIDDPSLDAPPVRARIAPCENCAKFRERGERLASALRECESRGAELYRIAQSGDVRNSAHLLMIAARAALHGWDTEGGQVKWRIDDVLRSVELPYGIEGFAYAVTDGERRLMFNRDEWDYAVATRDAWNAVDAVRALAAGVRGDTEGGGEK